MNSTFGRNQQEVAAGLICGLAPNNRSPKLQTCLVDRHRFCDQVSKSRGLLQEHGEREGCPKTQAITHLDDS